MPRVQRSGADLHYAVHGPADGLPVAYAPGFSAHSQDMLSRLLSGFLGRLGVRLLIVDHRGAGQTLTPPGAQASIDLMAEDMAAVMDAEAMPDAHILGISMGGCVAAAFALGFPQRTRSLTSVVSMARAPHPSRGGHILQTARLLRDAGVPQHLLNRISAVHLLDEAAFSDEKLLDEWENAPEDPFGQSYAMWEVQVNAMRNWDIRPALSGIRAPTLVFSSPDDVLVPPHFQAEVTAGIPGARQIDVPGGHLFMMHPLRLTHFVSELHAFWTGVEQARAG